MRCTITLAEFWVNRIFCCKHTYININTQHISHNQIYGQEDKIEIENGLY